MNVFLDTEFTDLVGIIRDPGLISIGLVTEDGSRTFYAELVDTYTNGICSDFVRAWVLPLLDAKPLPAQVDYKAVYARMLKEECRVQFGYWLAALQEPVQVLSDAPSYDWPYVQDLFDGHSWPAMLLPKPKSILACDMAELRHYEIKCEELFATRQYRRHHALDDALVSRMGYIAAKVRQS